MTFALEDFTVTGFQARLLQDTDVHALQGLLERCTDYSLLVSDAPPKPNAASSLLGDLPDGKATEDKLVVGFFTEEDGLIGVLDCVCDYPLKDDWWIGLLLIDPAYRGHGLGRKIYTSFKTWAKQHQVKRIYLGVLEDNSGALRYWSSLGFDEVDRRHDRYGGKEHVVVVMLNSLEYS